MSQVDSNFRQKLWAAADTLRGNISSEQYMLVVIGVLFLKYVSDKYDSAVSKIKAEFPDRDVSWFVKDKDVLSRYDCYFVIPGCAQWKYIAEHATSTSIGEKIDQAFLAIENENKKLDNLFDKNYNRQELDQRKLGQLISNFSNIDFTQYGEDTIGRTYEYFLRHFFKKQGQKGGEFYTPNSIVQLLVALIEPHQGKIYDPACGTGGMFIQAKQYMQKKKLNSKSLIVYGQEYSNKIWKLARINLLLHGFNVEDIHLGAESADTFAQDQHQGDFFDFVLANPPFNYKKWSTEALRNDSGWTWGIPPSGNANYAWLSCVLSKLNETGKAGVVLANGSLSSQQKAELAIRKKFIEKNKLDAIISLPDKLFFTTSIPACLWIFNNDKKNKDILMINGSNLEGNMLNKSLRQLTSSEIDKLAVFYQKHRNGEQIEEVGIAKSVDASTIVEADYSFAPGRYVGWKVDDAVDKDNVKKEIKVLATEIDDLTNQFNKLVPKLKVAIQKGLKHKDEEK